MKPFRSIALSTNRERPFRRGARWQHCHTSPEFVSPCRNPVRGLEHRDFYTILWQWCHCGPVCEHCWSMIISGIGFVARRHVLGAIVSAGAVLSVLPASLAATPPVIPSAASLPVLASHKALY